MSLTTQFPSDDPIFVPMGMFPEKWNALLSLNTRDARTRIADIIALPHGISARAALERDAPIAVLVPKKKRRRNDMRYHRLAVPLTNDHTMLFCSQFLTGPEANAAYPKEYIRILEILGGCQITQYGGELLAPRDADEIVDGMRLQIASAMEHSGPAVIEPFFAYGTGDYDCWLDQDYSGVWTFNHERADFEEYRAEGFVQWFENELVASLI